MRQIDPIKRIIFILCFIFAIGLVVMLVMNGFRDQSKEKQLAKVKEEAFPLEQELRKAQKELTELENSNNVSNELAQVMVAYQIGTVEDYELIREQSYEFKFKPTIVVDAVQDDADTLIDKARKMKYTVVLTATPIDDDALQTIAEFVEKYSIHSFLLRNVDDNDTALDDLASIGFKYCIRYMDSSDNVVLDNGLICSNYSLIKSGNFSIGARLSQLISSKQSLMFVFDLNGGQLSIDAIEYDLECIEDWIKQGEAEYVSLSNAVKTIENNESQTLKNQDDSSARMDELRAKIEELQKQIDEIYSHWNGN